VSDCDEATKTPDRLGPQPHEKTEWTHRTDGPPAQARGPYFWARGDCKSRQRRHAPAPEKKKSLSVLAHPASHGRHPLNELSTEYAECPGIFQGF